jgi:hypothetical protein
VTHIFWRFQSPFDWATALNELQYVLTSPTQIMLAPKSSAACRLDFDAIN